MKICKLLFLNKIKSNAEFCFFMKKMLLFIKKKYNFTLKNSKN